MREIAIAQGYLPSTPRDLAWREKLAYLAVEFLKHPQVECPLEHNFVDGCYYRTMSLPAGTTLIGRVHLKGHMCKLLRGELYTLDERSFHHHFAPDSLHTHPGYQMCMHALADCIVQTVHPNPEDERDIDKLETRWFEDTQDLIALGRRVHARLAAR